MKLRPYAWLIILLILWGGRALGMTSAGVEIRNRAEAVYQDAEGREYQSTSLWSVLTVAPVEAFTLTPVPDQELDAIPGNYAIFPYLLVNSGNVASTYTFVLNSTASFEIVEDRNGNGIVDGADASLPASIRLEEGESLNLLVVLITPADASLGEVFDNELQVSDTSGAPQLVRNQRVVIAEGGRVTVSKTVTLVGDSDGNGRPTPNDVVRWEITTFNRGDESLTEVSVTDLLPSGMAYEPGTLSSQSSNLGNGVTLLFDSSDDGVIWRPGEPLSGDAYVRIRLTDSSPAGNEFPVGAAFSFSFDMRIAPQPSYPATIDNKADASYRDRFGPHLYPSNIASIVVGNAAGLDLWVTPFSLGTEGSRLRWLAKVTNATDANVLVNLAAAGLSWPYRFVDRFGSPIVDSDIDGRPDFNAPPGTTDFYVEEDLTAVAAGSSGFLTVDADSLVGRVQRVHQTQVGTAVLSATPTAQTALGEAGTTLRVPFTLMLDASSSRSLTLTSSASPWPARLVYGGNFDAGQVTIYPGQPLTVYLEVDIPASSPTGSSEDFTVLVDWGSGTPLQIAIQVRVEPSVGLLISPDGARRNLNPGGYVEFPHTVTNAGSRDVTPRIDFQRDAAYVNHNGVRTMVSTKAARRWGFEFLINGEPLVDSDGDGQLDLGMLAAGDSRTFHVRVKAAEEAAIGTVLPFRVIGSAPAYASAMASSQAIVGGLPRFEAGTTYKRVAPEGQVEPGTELEYAIRVRNVGELGANNVTITDALPEGLGRPTVTAGEAEWNALTRTLVFSRPGLAVGEEWNVSFRTVVLDTATIDAELVNVAVIASEEVSPFRTNEARSLVLDRALRVAKSVDEKTAETGDFTHWNIVVENLSRSLNLRDVEVFDLLPPGLSYVPGSARVDGKPLANPERASNGTLRWELPDLASGTRRTITFLASVDPLRTHRTRVNAAWATARTPNAHFIQSATSRAILRIREGMFTDNGHIFGRVFVDANENGRFDSGEEGIGGVRLYLDDGSWALTDKYGLYHIPDVRPGTRVVRLDEVTLAPGLEPKANNMRFGARENSQLLRVPPSGSAKANFSVLGRAGRRHDLAVVPEALISTSRMRARLKLEVVAAAYAPPQTPAPAELVLRWEPLARPQPSADPLVAVMESLRARRLLLDGVTGAAFLTRKREFERGGFDVALGDALRPPQIRLAEDPAGLGLPETLTYRLEAEVPVASTLELSIPPGQQVIAEPGGALSREGDRWRVDLPSGPTTLTFRTRVLASTEPGVMLLEVRDRFTGLAVTAATTRRVLEETPFLSHTISGTQFGTDSEGLKDAAFDSLRLLGLFLADNPALAIDVDAYVEGPRPNSDSRFADNASLAQARAEAVAGVWSELGIAENRIRIRAFGNEDDSLDNFSVSGRSRNQRVEINFRDRRTPGATLLAIGAPAEAVIDQTATTSSGWLISTRLPPGRSRMRFAAADAGNMPPPAIEIDGLAMSPAAITQGAGAFYFDAVTGQALTIRYQTPVSGASLSYYVPQAVVPVAPRSTEVDRLNLQGILSGTELPPTGRVSAVREASDFLTLSVTSELDVMPSSQAAPQLLPFAQSLTQAVVDPTPRLVYPAADGVAYRPSLKVQAVVHVATEPHLYVNGERVPGSNRALMIEDVKAQRAAMEWIGLALQPGKNHVVLEARDQFNIVRLREERTIWLAGEVSRIGMMAAPATLPADRRSIADVAIRLLDAQGLNVLDSRFVTLIFEGIEPIDPDANAHELGYQAFVTGGMARVRVRAPGDVRESSVTATYAGHTQRLPIRIVPGMRDWIVVGYGEGTVGYRSMYSHVEPADGSHAFPNQVFIDGKTSFFLRGKIRGEYLLTAAADTKRVPDPASVYEGIEPNHYYPVYGDDSVTGKDAPVSGPLYIKLEKGKSYLFWGDYDTSFNDTVLAAYNRVFNGLALRYDSPQLSAKGFANYGAQAHVVEELRANGTSGFYFLTAQPIVVASETLEIVTRDRSNEEYIISREPLYRGQHYDLDYLAGTILFHQPQPALDANLNPRYIRVTYEVEEGDTKFWTVGARIRTRPTNFLEVGITEVREERLGDTYNLAGVDAKVALPFRTVVSAELAQSRSEIGGVGTAQRYGLESRPTGEWEIWADGYRLPRAFENLYSLLHPGATGGRLRTLYRLNSNLDLIAAQTLEKREGPPESLVSASSLAARMTWANRQIEARYLHVESVVGDEKDGDDTIKLSGRTPLINKLSGSAFGEQSARRWRGNAAGLGLDYQVRQTTRLYSRYENRSRELFLVGDSNLTQALPSALSTQSGRQNLLIAGVDSSFDYGFTAYSEYRGNYNPEQQTDQAATGLRNRYPLTPRWTLSGFVERLETLRGPEELSHWAFGAGADYTEASRARGMARSEYRIAAQERTLLLVEAIAYRLMPGITLLQKDIFYRGWGISERLSNRAMLGAAWRPLNFDYVHAFARLEYKREKAIRTVSEDRTVGLGIVEIFGEPAPVLELRAKLGTKHVTERGYADIDPLTTNLLVGGFWYQFMNRFAAGYEERLIYTPRTAKRDTSRGVEVGWNAVDDFWLSVGYNWKGFEDRDFAGHDFWSQGPYLRLRVKFDEKNLESVMNYE